MRTARYAIVILAVAVLLLAAFALSTGKPGFFRKSPQAADNYVGSWHNKKGSFNTLGFSLRKDGRGVFSTAVLPLILRWERTDTGILLKIGGDGRTEEMQLSYDAATQTFTQSKPDGSKEMFWRVSTAEPPDVEAQMEEQRLKEEEALPKSTELKQEVASRDDLLRVIQTWAERESPNVHGLTAFVRAGDSSWRCTFRNMSGDYSVEIPVIDKSAGKLTPGISYGFAQGAEPDLPTRFSLPKTQVDALRKWLTEQEISFSDSAYEARGAFQVEAYFSNISIKLKSDRDKFLSVARYLIGDLFRDTKPPYSFTTSERKDP